jgi:hypothetical protein
MKFLSYWSAVLLAVASALLMVLGMPSKAALAGAGFAFLGRPSRGQSISLGKAGLKRRRQRRVVGATWTRPGAWPIWHLLSGEPNAMN